MRLTTETPQCYRYRVILDGVDITDTCLVRVADEEAGEVECLTLHPAYIALIRTSPPDKPPFPQYVVSSGRPVTYTVQGKVEVIRDDSR